MLEDYFPGLSHVFLADLPDVPELRFFRTGIINSCLTAVAWRRLNDASLTVQRSLRAEVTSAVRPCAGRTHREERIERSKIDRQSCISWLSDDVSADRVGGTDGESGN